MYGGGGGVHNIRTVVVILYLMDARVALSYYLWFVILFQFNSVMFFYLIVFI